MFLPLVNNTVLYSLDIVVFENKTWQIQQIYVPCHQHFAIMNRDGRPVLNQTYNV